MNNRKFLIIIILTFLSLSLFVYWKLENIPNDSLRVEMKNYTTENVKGSGIEIYLSKNNQVISLPFEFYGKAKGVWFFEGDFPVLLVDRDGKIIAESYATAQGEWTTEDFVDFRAGIEFDIPECSNRGTLIFQKDNPSDLPELDDAVEIPVLLDKLILN